jgi:hypothetical protein
MQLTPIACLKALHGFNPEPVMWYPGFKMCSFIWVNWCRYASLKKSPNVTSTYELKTSRKAGLCTRTS